MTTHDTIRTLLDAPLAHGRGPRALGRAVWLYVAFLRAANDQGLAIRTRGALARDLAVDEASVDRWLDRLLRAGLIAVLSRAPFLTVRLRAWPGGSEQAGDPAGIGDS